MAGKDSSFFPLTSILSNIHRVLTKGSAAVLLESAADPAADLQLLTLKGTQAPTVAQALFALTTDGGVELPCLGKKDGRIEERGMVLWSGEN